MAIFFYVVALEVKRELLFGSLRDRASAAVPVAAALGTMVGGAVVYLLVNFDGGELRGWAVPIATDIAFALGALGLVGRRAPSELRAFLLTLAVVDDLGTIAVIGLFYTDVDLAVVAAGRGGMHARRNRAAQRSGCGTSSPTSASPASCGWPCTSPAYTPRSPGSCSGF